MGFCYQKNFCNPTMPVDEAQFYALVRGTEWGEKIDKFRETGDQAIKRKLPAFIFQATFDDTTSKAGKIGPWRKQSATKLTGLVVMDLDHIDNPLTLYQGWIEKGLDMKALGIVLIYISPSGKGLKIVFKARLDWGNLIDNQYALAHILGDGVVPDEACKDASRMSFVCKESDILYIDKELFTYENKEFAERYNALYRDGHSQATNPNNLDTRRDKGQGPVTSCDRYQSPVTANQSPVTPVKPEKTFKGIAYEDIIEEWWKINGGVPQEGERNVKLYQLAVSLRAICDNNKQLVYSVLPRLGLDNLEVERIVESACKEPPKGLSKGMQEVLSILNPKKAEAPTASEIDQWLWDWGEQIEALFPYFPLLQDACKGLKRNQYPAALVVSGAFSMTLMTRCRYSFYHRPEELRRLNSSALIIGDPASGKSFATRLYKLLTAPILAADRVGKDAINAYREQMKTKGANKEKPKKPKVTIRIHPARTSNAQFIQDMVNAVEEVDGEPMQLHMLTFDTELDNTLSIQKGGSWIDKQTLELKAFHNEEDGQFYTNMDSVIENFIVTWNYVYTGTPLALKNKVNDRNFGSGLPTRLTCIPLPATNFQMLTRESTVDLESDNRISEWAKKLDKTKGILPFGKIHAINFSAPFIVMRHWGDMKQDGEYWHGEFETDEIDWKLAELIVNMQYACQRHYFLGMAEKYFDDQQRDVSVNAHRKNKTYEGFSRLPDEFMTEDVMTCFSLVNRNAAKIKISRMIKDHLIERAGDFVENGTTKAIYKKIGIMV